MKRGKNTISLSALLGKPITISEKFHEKTKLKRVVKDPGIDNWPEEWKTVYFKAYSRLPEIPLPQPTLNTDISFKKTLLERKSIRNFSAKPITLNKLGTLLYYSAGLHNKKKPTVTNRFYPSAGARYPLEVYILSLNTKLKKGLYHYYVKNNSLEKLLEVDTLPWKKYFLQNDFAKASCMIIITAVFKRNTVKYGDRGYRLILQESGHMAQNFYLTATALNLACCTTAGFIDNQINQLLDIKNSNESVVYVLAIGEKGT